MFICNNIILFVHVSLQRNIIFYFHIDNNDKNKSFSLKNYCLISKMKGRNRNRGPRHRNNDTLQNMSENGRKRKGQMTEDTKVVDGKKAKTEDSKVSGWNIPEDLCLYTNNPITPKLCIDIRQTHLRLSLWLVKDCCLPSLSEGFQYLQFETNSFWNSVGKPVDVK